MCLTGLMHLGGLDSPLAPLVIAYIDAAKPQI
jgi:hypothetical protein